MTPTSPVSVTLDGQEVLLERVELAGWRRASITSPTTITFVTPASVSRSYTINNPNISTNMRVFGAVDVETVYRKFVRENEDPTPIEKARMFIAPVDVKASRSKSASGDAISDASDGADIRLMLNDGFEVMVILPAEKSSGGVAASDLAHGDVLKAVLRTFFGLRLPQPEFDCAGTYVALPEGHGMASYDGANYMHRYSFQVRAQLTNQDTIAPYNWPNLTADDFADFSVIEGVDPVGVPPLRDIVIPSDPADPELGGIIHHGHNSPLIGTLNMDQEI